MLLLLFLLYLQTTIEIVPKLVFDPKYESHFLFVYQNMGR